MTTIKLSEKDIKKVVDERIELDKQMQQAQQQKQQVDRAIQMIGSRIDFVSGQLAVMGITDINEYLKNAEKDVTQKKLDKE